MFDSTWRWSRQERMYTDPLNENVALRKQVAALQRELRMSRDETTYLLAIMRRIVKTLRWALTRQG